MLQSLILAKAEDVEKSKEICVEMGTEITPERKRELQAELERIAGPVRRRIIEECLSDLNGLGPLLRGKMLGERQERYEIETDNMSKVQRYGWEMTVIDGKKKIFDPARKGTPQYEDVPRMTIEKTRVLYLVETNRDAVARIADLLKEFLGKLRGELCHASIDTIIDEKRAVEVAIAKVDRRAMTQETFTEAALLDAADYIQRPVRYPSSASGPDNDLFRQFETAKASINA
jgi:hypothetical protein